MPDNFKEKRKLNHFIKKALKSNPYNKKKEETGYKMWKEQCKINFPILYLSSIYLYEYGRERGCNNYLFATRDCCHFYKIFKELYPEVSSTYFHCSRNMFENATENKNEVYKSYVREQIKDKISKTVFIDIHGTGKRMFAYFEKEFDKVPYCFLLSATFNNFEQFPSISRYYYKKNKIYNLMFDTRGSPIEMLNYDNIGTLHNFCEEGPIRDKLEYDLELIKPYHECINYFVDLMEPINSNIDCRYKLRQIKQEIKDYFGILKKTELILSNYIRHIGKHKKKDLMEIKEKNLFVNNNMHNDTQTKKCEYDTDVRSMASGDIIFERVISDDTVYSIVWEGTYKNIPCVIKMIKLDTGICDKNNVVFTYSNEEPFRHKDFKDKKEMCKDKFMHEINQLKYLNKKNIAPELYSYWISEKYEVHYGFIVMEKYDCSLKQVFQKRLIEKDEEKIIFKKINKLHGYKFIHGDMKPSNIGIKLDHNGKIAECCLFDCSKVRHKDQCRSSKFNYYVKKDWNTYFKHKEANMKNCCFNK